MKKILVTLNPRQQITVRGTAMRIAQTLALLESFYPTERETVLKHALLYFGIPKEKL